MSLLLSCGASLRAFSLDGKETPVPTDSNYISTSPTAACWYPNGRLLAVGLSSGTIAFHHHAQLEPIGNFNASSDGGKPSAVQCIDVTAGSRFLAVGTHAGELLIWDMKASQVVNRLPAGGPVVAVSFQHTTDSRYVACAAGADVLVYSRASGRLVDRFTVASGKDAPGTPEGAGGGGGGSPLPSAARAKVTAAAFSVHALNLLAVTDDGGCVTVWDVSRTHASRAGSAGSSQRAAKIGTDDSYSRFTSPLRTPAMDIAFAPPTSSVGMLVAGLDKHVRVYDKMLRRFLFSVSCSGPVASVAHCADDAHIAAGLTSGEIAIFKVDFHGKSSKVVATVPADTESKSVRSLHFQPQLSGQDASQTPRVPKSSASADDIQTPGQFRTPPTANQRARTSPSPGFISGMLPPMPHRALDDNALRSTPRDSDLFSPMSRPVQNSRRFPLYTPEKSGAAALPGKSPMAMPVVNDRRMSDLIPSKAAPAPQHSTYQDTSRGQDSVLDTDAADSLLGSSGHETFGTAGAQSRPFGSRPVEQVNNAPLPRGQAFRRLRKSSSDVSEHNQRPPLHPRSRTASNLNTEPEEGAPKADKPPAPVSAPPSVTPGPAASGSVPSPDDGDFWTPKKEQEQDTPPVKIASPPPPKPERPNGHGRPLAEINKVVKQAITLEMGALREDVRSDVLNIHTELVLSSSKQVQEMRKLFTDQNRVIAELRKEVAELRKSNDRLHEIYNDE